jgi:phage head maturation protease
LSQDEATQQIKTLDLTGEHVLAVDAEKRILGLRVIRYNEVVEHPAYGRLLFLPGAFVKPDPSQVRLRMDHEDPPTGLGVSYRDQPDAPYMDFRVSKTQRGDEQLTLAKDGVSRGTSPGFRDVPGKPQQKLVDGKLTTVYGPNSAQLAEVSTTWMPTFEGDSVVYVLSNEQKEKAPMGENDSPAIEVGIDYDAMAKAMGAAISESTASAIDKVLSKDRDAASETKAEKLLAKFDELLEMQRASFAVPGSGEAHKPQLYDWVQYTLRRMRGESMSSTEVKELALDDVITSEQPGLVPNLLIPDYNDIINQDRPFLSSTRQIAPPETGTSMLLPIITTRAVAGTQAGNAEKGALTTTATKVGTGTFAYKAVFGGADISIQMIQRAGRSFFDILTGDMGMAYALDCDSKAITALLAGYTDSASVAHHVVDGSAFGPLDPEDPAFGLAWKNSILACKRAPTHIWMNAAAVAAFIDAKAPVTNAPLYSNLAASFTAAGGTGGTLSGLIPVYVPALDTAAVDVIIGPASGFVWAEDPALNLQADVPSVAGRDIALVGGIFPAPRYASAFTTYTITS